MPNSENFVELEKEFRKGDIASLAQAISLVENSGWDREEIAKRFGLSKYPYVLGITGSPGVGKSTTLTALLEKFRQEKLKVAVLAIDPSSPITGGALLGDRIRMQNYFSDPYIFIRSLATRGALGGLSQAVPSIFPILGAANFDVVIVETVGVGQSEIEIMKYADTVLVILSPGTGDDIQAAKAGIMEIGNIYLVNKSDLEGAENTFHTVEQSIHMNKAAGSVQPDIVLGAMLHKEKPGLDVLWKAIQKHKKEVGTSKHP